MKRLRKREHGWKRISASISLQSYLLLDHITKLTDNNRSAAIEDAIKIAYRDKIRRQKGVL